MKEEIEEKVVWFWRIKRAKGRAPLKVKKNKKKLLINT